MGEVSERRPSGVQNEPRGNEIETEIENKGDKREQE